MNWRTITAWGMRWGLLALLGIWGATEVRAQVFSEDFGSTFSTTYLGLPNWSSCRSTSSNSSSGPCAGFPDYGAYISNNQYLTTDQQFIPGTGYCLSFSYSYNAATGFPRVQIGTGGAFCFSAMTWTDLATLPQTSTCDVVSYSLDAWAGQSIWIRFQAGAGFTSWYLDDILIDVGACGGGGGPGSCTSTVFQDGFSDGSIGAPEWTSTAGTFVSSTTPCNGGDYRVYFSTFAATAEAITADIDLSTATYAQLDMDYYMSSAAYDFHCAYVDVSTNGGLSWTDVGATYTDPDGTCQHLTHDLSAYVGNTIRLRIRRRTTSYSFYFDNVEVCSDGGPAQPKIKWADNFNDNDLVLDYLGTGGDEDCPSCGPWVLGGGASLNLVPAGGWNGNTNETEAFPDNMANVYYVRLDRNEWVESPTLDLSQVESFKISFYAKSSSPGTGGGDQWSFSDRLRLQIWDGSTWVTVQSMRDDLAAGWAGPDDFISAALPFNYFCFSAYKSSTSPGNYYYNAAPHVNPAWFHSQFKFRVLFEGGISGSPFAWVDDFTFRADADGYSTMIPCGLSFWNEPAATSYGQDLGTTGNNNAEKGVELELDNAIGFPPVWASEADDGDVVDQVFGAGESERVVFCVLSEQRIQFAFPRVHWYAPDIGWQSTVMSEDATYSGPGWRYYAVEYISCDLAGGTIALPTDQFRYYYSFEYGIEFMPVFYQLNTSGIEYGGGVTSLAETFDAPDVTSSDFCGSLPVVYTDIRAEWDGADGLLHWVTSQEIGHAGWRVERQLNGGPWEVLGEVPAQGESGGRYHHRDPNLAAQLSGYALYRLRAMDLGGSGELSEVVMLSATDPGPGLELLQGGSGLLLSLGGEPGQTGRWQLTDALGRVLRSGEVQMDGLRVQVRPDVAGLSGGIYWISWQVDGQRQVRRWLHRP